jgi:hypothetical protein
MRIEEEMKKEKNMFYFFFLFANVRDVYLSEEYNHSLRNICTKRTIEKAKETFIQCTYCLLVANTVLSHGI